MYRTSWARLLLPALAAILALAAPAHAAWVPFLGNAVCTAPLDQVSPVAVPDGSGGAIVAWVDLGYGSNVNVFATRIGADGVLAPGWPTGGVAICSAAGGQDGVKAVSDGAGGAIIVWRDDRTNASDIYAQRIQADGTIASGWPANGVALCTDPAFQIYLGIASDGAGGAIVAWDDYRSGSSYDIYAQRVTASGAIPAGWPVDGRALCTAAYGQHFAVPIADQAGGAIVAWQDDREFVTTGTHVFATRITADGAISAGWPLDGVALCTAQGQQTVPAIASDGAGGALVAWQDQRLTSLGLDVSVQRVTPSGALAAGWPTDGVALCTASGDQTSPVIVASGSGGAIVAWEDTRGGPVADLYAQRIAPTGALAAGWPTNGRAVCTAVGNQRSLTIVADGVDGALVCWHDYRTGGWDIYAQRLTPMGSIPADWPANGTILCNAPDQQRFPSAVPDGAGGGIAVWQDRRSGSRFDIYAQRIAPSITFPGIGAELCTSSGDQTAPAAAVDGADGAIVAWQDTRSGTGTQVYALRLTAELAKSDPWPAPGLLLASGSAPAIRSDGSGGAFVGWLGTSDDGIHIYGQHLTGVGQIVSGWPAGGLRMLSGVVFDLVADEAGGAIWVCEYSNLKAISALRFTSAGAIAPGWPAAGVLLTTAGGFRYSPRAASDGAAGVFVAWADTRNNVDQDIYLQRVSAAGVLAPGWPVDGVPVCVAQSDQASQAILSDGTGGAFVAWQDDRSPTSSRDIYLQHLTGSGTLAPGWPTNGLPVCAASGGQVRPRLAPDGAGGVFLAWEDQRSGSSADVYAQRITGAGAIGVGWLVDGLAVCSVAGEQTLPDLVFDGTGGVIVGWEDARNPADTDLYYQHLLADGTLALDGAPGGKLVGFAPGTQSTFVVVPSSSSTGIFAWQDRRSGTSWDVYANRTTPGVVSDIGLHLASQRFFPVWPNPFGGEIHVGFHLDMSLRVRIEVLDVAGRRVRTWLGSPFSPGRHEIVWDGRDDDGFRRSAGVYFVRMRWPGFDATRKIVRSR